MAKTKYSKEGKGGKTLQTWDEKWKAMSHKGRKNQTWKEQQMDRAEELWLQNEDKTPKEKLSMRAIAEMCGLPKTTVIERLLGCCKGHGHIAGGKRQPRVLSKGEQAGQQAGQNNRNHFNWSFKWVNKWVSKQVITLKVNTTFDSLLLANFLAFYIRTRRWPGRIINGVCKKVLPFFWRPVLHVGLWISYKDTKTWFLTNQKRAGRAWRKSFMDRKPWLRKKNAQNLSAVRAMAANPVQVDKFFDLLKKWVRDWEMEFKPNHLWNVDETGITDVLKERKVLGITREHVFQTVADEKGTTTTVVSFASAGGLHVPPMVIFKAGRVKDIWREAAPSGYTIKCSESGYINADLFADYGAKFLNFLKEENLLGNGQKNLLLLDLQSSHLFNT